MITDRQLKIFSAVYETASMTKAGQKLYMSQSAVSQTINEVESSYKLQLFERRGGKLYNTQAGDTLYRYGLRIQNLHSELNDILSENSGIKKIRIGANFSAGTSQICDFIELFHTKYPQISVEVKILNGGLLKENLNNNDLDLCLMEDFIEKELLEKYTVIPYYQDRILVVASPDHPLTNRNNIKLKDLKDQSMLFREKHSGVRKQFESLLQLKGVSISPIWESSSSEAIVNAIQKGFGISVLPYLLVKEYLKEKSLVEIPIQDISLSRNLNIVYHRDKILTDPLKFFIEIVQNNSPN